MTLGNTINETIGVGNGSQTLFPFNFKVINAGMVQVFTQSGTADPAPKSVGTDYAITLYSTTDGGEITFTVPPENNVNIIMHRTPDYLQATQFPLNRNLDERALERALDKLTMQDQDLRQTQLRSIQFPFGSSSSLNAVLPPLAGRANKAIGFDALGNVAMYNVGDVVNTNILATGTTTSRNLEDRFSDNATIFNVRDFGAVGDGLTNDRAAIQAALDKGGQAYPVTVIIPVGRWLIGTNQPTGVGQEVPLFYHSNTTIIIEGTIIHNTNNNNGANFVLGPDYYAESPAPATRLNNVHIKFRGNGKIIYPTRTRTQSRKGLGIYWTDLFSLDRFTTEGTDFSNYNLTVLNSAYGTITDTNIQAGGAVTPGNAEGEDGIHFVGSCHDIAVVGGVINCGDACIAITCESAFQSNSEAYNIIFANLVCRTWETAAFDFSFVNASFTPNPPKNSLIRDITIIGCQFGIQAKGYNAGLVGQVINRTPADGNILRNINFIGCSGDGTGMANTTDTPAVWLKDVQDVDLGDFKIRNYSGTGVSIENCVRSGLNQGHRVTDYTNQTTTVAGLTISGINYQSSTTMRIQYSGSPSLAGITASSTYYANVAGAANAINNGRYLITAINDTSKYVDVLCPTTRSAAQDETGLALANNSVVRRIGSAATRIIGGTSNFVKGGYYNNASGRGILLQLGTINPTNTLIEGNTFENCMQREVIRTNGCLYGRIIGNRFYNCNAVWGIREDNNTANEYNQFLDNIDIGPTTRCLQSFEFARASDMHRGNMGTNKDLLTGSITVLAAATTGSVTINLSDHTEFLSSQLTTRHMRITPTANLGTATKFWLTLSGRVYTVNVDAAPGADITFDYRFEPVATL